MIDWEAVRRMLPGRVAELLAMMTEDAIPAIPDYLTGLEATPAVAIRLETSTGSWIEIRLSIDVVEPDEFDEEPHP
jgi:hypothetical protein